MVARADGVPRSSSKKSRRLVQAAKPSVSRAKLAAKWVLGAEVVYIGVATAGSKGDRGIATRLNEFRRHGCGGAHRALGRSLPMASEGQPANLLVGWRQREEDPEDVEIRFAG